MHNPDLHVRPKRSPTKTKRSSMNANSFTTSFLGINAVTTFCKYCVRIDYASALFALLLLVTPLSCIQGVSQNRYHLLLPEASKFSLNFFQSLLTFSMPPCV
jgi:hypothetical protein